MGWFEIDFTTSSAKIFHLGYLLLLDAIDQSEPEHGTVGAALLAKARAAGMKTSIDVVSEDSDRFSKIIGPALKQVDYCILNEVEGSKVTGVKVREDGKLLNDGIEETASKLFDLGVGNWSQFIFLRGLMPSQGRERESGTDLLLCLRDISKEPQVRVMPFVQGVLYGVHENWSLEKSLLTGTCAATACMSDPTCTDGLRSLKNALLLPKSLELEKTKLKNFFHP